MTKVVLFCLFALSWTLPAFGQGQVVFANKVGTVVDAPVFTPSLSRGPGPDYSVQLYLVGSDLSSLTPLLPASVFRAAGSGASAIADRYWVNQTVDVPGVQPGAPATFVVRAWRTSAGSYDLGAFGDKGESAPFTITVGGGILPPANLITLQGFVFSFPEPSPITLGAVGGAVLLAVGAVRRSSER